MAPEDRARQQRCGGRPISVSPDRKSIIVESGRAYPITNMFDIAGDETEEFDLADRLVAGDGDCWFSVPIESVTLAPLN